MRRIQRGEEKHSRSAHEGFLFYGFVLFQFLQREGDVTYLELLELATGDSLGFEPKAPACITFALVL